MATDSIHIAIIGGGLAGASLANALVRIPRLQIKVFESAPEFSERGAAIGLSRNAQRALRQFIPSAMELLNKAGAVPMRSSRVMIGSGPQAGTFVCDVGDEDPSLVAEPGLVIHRASLLRELLAPLPREVLHANKKVASIQCISDGVSITFHDDQVEKFDAVIGADGVFSTVRKHVVPSNEWTATPSGFWDCRNLIPYDRATATIGNEYFELDRQYGWVGDGAYFLHDVLENKTMVQCVMSGVEDHSPPNRIHTLTRPFLEEKLKSWLDGPIAKKMIDLLIDQPRPEGYSALEHKATSTYANGRICIVGDAAHAMTPWQGAGAGQAIEDAMILGALLSELSSATDIDAAFQAFDAVRRPRCQQIIDSSRGTGQIMCGQNPDVALDAHEIKQALASRWGFIHMLDMTIHKEDAVRKMRDYQAR
ncbi:salicylate hydroxylase [Biscogniauxia marginata]|nr:salicylate hydroxylase [Biscogniauxia marginata]